MQLGNLVVGTAAGFAIAAWAGELDVAAGVVVAAVLKLVAERIVRREMAAYLEVRQRPGTSEPGAVLRGDVPSDRAELPVRPRHPRRRGRLARRAARVVGLGMGAVHAGGRRDGRAGVRRRAQPARHHRRPRRRAARRRPAVGDRLLTARYPAIWSLSVSKADLVTHILDIENQGDQIARTPLNHPAPGGVAAGESARRSVRYPRHRQQQDRSRQHGKCASGTDRRGLPAVPGQPVQRRHRPGAARPRAATSRDGGRPAVRVQGHGRPRRLDRVAPTSPTSSSRRSSTSTGSSGAACSTPRTSTTSAPRSSRTRSVAVVAVENLWAIPFIDAVRRAGGELVDQVRVPSAVVTAVRDAAQDA